MSKSQNNISAFNFEKNNEKIEQIKSKRKWKQIAKQLNKPELEEEEEEEEKFLDNIKIGNEKYTKKLLYKFDEFGTEFTPFNMNEELEEGNIDDTGYYVHHVRKEE
jgi:hypothetical protein